MYLFTGTVFPSLVVEPELVSRMYPYGAYLLHMLEETGYMHLQASKPDTIGGSCNITIVVPDYL